LNESPALPEPGWKKVMVTGFVDHRAFGAELEELEARTEE